MDTATRLFAQLGYDAVSLEMISEAAGAELGGMRKRDLYFAVMERAIGRRNAYLEPVIAEFTPDADWLVRLVDRFLDFSLDHPEMPSLWMHRWMSDAQDITDFDERFGWAWMMRVGDLVRQVVPPHVDATLVLWTSIWSINSFVHAGLLLPEGRLPPQSPEAQRRFRAYLDFVLRQVASAPEG
ncbi:MAG TPA: TetR/AcrR family transcriptional regulator [Thermomonospora sp.]|nr:TetR/AcrR family transcriptional regulator [Thermomonospora sp.]